MFPGIINCAYINNIAALLIPALIFWRSCVIVIFYFFSIILLPDSHKRRLKGHGYKMALYTKAGVI